MEKRGKSGTGAGRHTVTQMEAMSGKLDLFTKIPVESHIKDITTSTYECTGLETRGPYQFRLDPVPNHFLDLSSIRVHGKFKVVPLTGTEPRILGTGTSIVNMAPQSLFSTIDTYVNDKLVSLVYTPAMQYKAYIETLLTYDRDAARTHLACERWFTDSKDHFESHNADNYGNSMRQIWLTNHKGEIDFSMPLHEDLCTCPKFFPPNVEMKYRLSRTPDSFTMFQLDPKDNANLALQSPLCRIDITELKLSIRKIIIDQPTCNAIESKIRNGGMPSFPFIRSELHSRQINSGQLSFKSHLLLVGDNLPRSIIACFVDQKKFNGDRYTNPYNFEHFDIEEAYLNVNEVMKPQDHYRWDFTNKYYMHGYRQFLDNIGVINSRDVNMVTPDLYAGGAFFMAWDLSECLNFHKHLPLSGKIDVSVKFRKPLAQNTTMLIFVTKHDTMYLDRHFAPIMAADYNPPPHKLLKTTA